MHRFTLAARRRRAIGLLAALLAASGAAHADNLLTNGGFEDINGTFPTDGSLSQSITSGSTAIPGWTVTTNELAWQETGQSGINSQEGSFNVDLTGRCDLGRNCPPAGGYGALSQTIATQAGQTYDLHFYGGTFSGNTTAAPTLVASAGTTSESFLLPVSTDPSGTWTGYDLFFVATGASSVITFTGSGGIQDQTAYLGLDNASVTPIPLPAAAWLLLSGLGGFGVFARKKRAAV